MEFSKLPQREERIPALHPLPSFLFFQDVLLLELTFILQSESSGFLFLFLPSSVRKAIEGTKPVMRFFFPPQELVNINTGGGHRTGL